MLRQDDNLPGQPTSVWMATTAAPEYEKLTRDVEVDVAIVGGGLVGLSVATYLKAEGMTVAILESDRIASGVSGFTTAKITSQHSLIYSRLVREFGEEKAAAYGMANETAITEMGRFVGQFGIDCDFQADVAHVFTEHDEEVQRFREEAEVAARLGLPASFVSELPLPLSVKGAVRFDNQARFHPRKYMLALASRIPGDGSFIFENTRVMGFHDADPCTIDTPTGEVTARHVVIASHFPLNDPILYALRMYQHRSYVLGVRLQGPLPEGMYISTEPVHSLRRCADEHGEMLLVGGEGHRTGEGGDTVFHYRNLEAWARQHFPVLSVDYRWSTQDTTTADGVPYIGPLNPSTERLFVATGFDGWGMTHSTVAGMLLRDLILGRKNPWADLYNPNRVNLAAAAGLAKDIGSIASHFLGDRRTDTKAEDLMAGEGMIVEEGKEKVAMYRASDGAVHRLSPACTHLGCFVQWNSAEKSWDCPCHGSRFALDGSILEGPAIYPLKPVE